MFNTIYIRNFRNRWATNSSSTHSVIYKNKDQLMKDLNVFELNFFGRYDETIAASKEAKIKYVAFNLFWNDELMDILCKIYPTMQQYVDLCIKEQKKEDNGEISYFDREYGMCGRENLSFGTINNFHCTLDYIRTIIDNDDIAIVGGSDETDFVYNILDNHKEFPKASYYETIIKNGNYWVSYSPRGERLRFSLHDKPLKPDYPELIDLHITNKCEHNCSFCYQASNKEAQHADIEFIKKLFNSLDDLYNPRIEFAIGGGNILLYPDLEELFEYLNSKGHFINTTLNAKDLPTLANNKKLFNLFNKYVKGVGISVSSMEDVALAKKFAEKYIEGIDDNGEYIDPKEKIEFKPYTVIHLIPEYLGFEKSTDYVNTLRHYYSFLFLGYKRLGRGLNISAPKLTEEELKILCNRSGSTSIDTCFANTYKETLEKFFSTRNTITYYEGEFSMYVDAVNKIAYKSSYQKEKEYPFYKDDRYVNILNNFKEIRADNNLE